jgi:hypothetical protein
LKPKGAWRCGFATVPRKRRELAPQPGVVFLPIAHFPGNQLNCIKESLELRRKSELAVTLLQRSAIFAARTKIDRLSYSARDLIVVEK